MHRRSRPTVPTLSQLLVLPVALLLAPGAHAAGDSDADGVDDRRDACAKTAAGATVNQRGCEFDDDGDGVVDRLDACPDTRPGALVTTRGCEPDSDRDGVADRLDRCADSRPASRIDNDGCEFDDIVPLRGLGFDTGEASLTPASERIVAATATLLRRYPELCFEVEGYTDNVGAAASNRRLSLNRARTVMARLIAAGVDASALGAVGYCEDRPVASNRTAAGRERNRRVQLRVVDC
ncbi:MAG: OmpA family protein [Pseudomonadota bacterium]